MAKPAFSDLQTLPLTGSTSFPDSGAQWGTSVQIQEPTVGISHSSYHNSPAASEGQAGK